MASQPMLLPFLRPLLDADSPRKRTIILASGSPRRREILSQMGIPFRVEVSDFPETLEKSSFSNPVDYVRQTAFEKGYAVLAKLRQQSPVEPLLVISADTVIITLDSPSCIIEKPTDNEHAKCILSELSGRPHCVVTAFCLLFTTQAGSLSRIASTNASDDWIHGGGWKCRTCHESTRVTFGALDESWIDAYVLTGEPMGKAGGYGYQGLGSALISKIDGCYYNVVGFPTHRFLKTLEEAAGSGDL
ncbi:acetylserotonin O-methyltransferase-like protein [Polychytrium aggregatum]|uniref:acetylserotonin O-methyltransferase-like protein n=1 Tax=Polychytrium aggregatum TaxID=110093 RepID=UPI0022FF2E98|nr:acetylserotonin O-methyltransferase-like protein [Polychytrium aggregatum]KAI9197303.1 acetylserotonin O-methyltransferase-like protein [Polychytrium aggregatum]